MDSSQTKNIEIHMATQIQENLNEFIKGLNLASQVDGKGQLEVTETQTSGENSSSKNQVYDQENLSKKQKQLGDDQNSRMVREKNQTQSLEKLLHKGNNSKDQTETNKLLSILDEIDNPQTQSGETASTFTKNTFQAPAPTQHLETNEDPALKFESEQTDENSDQQQFEDDFEDEDSEEEKEEQEQTLSLKETNPGYYNSLVFKV